MMHAFFMIAPIVLIAASVIALLTRLSRGERLVWSFVLVVAVVVLLAHVGIMEFYIGG